MNLLIFFSLKILYDLCLPRQSPAPSGTTAGALCLPSEIQRHFTGVVNKESKKNKMVEDCISEAIKIFEEREAEVFLKRARDAIESLR